MSGLGPIADAWLAWIADAAWRAALLGAGLWLVDPLLARSRWPELRHGLWLLVPLSLIMPPRVAWPWGGILPAAGAELGRAAGSDPSAGGNPIALILLATWACSAAAWLLVAWRRERRWAVSWLERSHSADARVQATAQRAAARLGLRRTPEVRVDPAGTGPLVAGWPRPVVLLPQAGAATWSDADLEHVLCHELAHLRRGDLAIERGVALVTRLFWFHPAAHLAHRRAHAAREFCCDATVAACVGRDYRRTLVRIAARTLLAPAHGVGLGLGVSPSLTLLRLRALDRFPNGTSRLERWAVLGALVLVACAVLPTSSADRRSRELAEARASALAATGGKPAGYSSMQARMAILRLNALEAESQAVTGPPTPTESR
ncbi:MAG TPA: M56 family metallopeptidase [Gemmatimonadales bacterium]|nr:M56 family metallopeptidase [Gemmatimonadales bacterium]